MTADAQRGKWREWDDGVAERRDPLPPRSRVSRTEWKLTEFLRAVWKQRVNVSHSGNPQVDGWIGRERGKMPWIAGCTRTGMYLQGERGHNVNVSSPIILSVFKMTSRPGGKPWNSIEIVFLFSYLFTLNAVGGKGQQGLLPNRCHVGTRAVALGDWLRCGWDEEVEDGASQCRMLPCQKRIDFSVACSLRQDRKIEVGRFLGGEE